jgi:hypothetical protein
MNRDDLKKKLDFLPITRKMAQIVDEIAKAQEAAGVDSFFDFIEQVILKYNNTKPKLHVISKEDTLHDFLKEVYDSNYTFDDCDDPEMLRSFCTPHSGNRELRYDELTVQQQRTVRFIDMRYRNWKKSNKALSQPNQNDIEKALDNTIRKKIREDKGE